MIKSGLSATLLMATVIGLSSCNSTSDDYEDFKPVNLNLLSEDFNDKGYWNDCYNVNVGAVRVDGFAYSHSASAFEYDGVTYTSWEGFCPSRVNDTADHGSDWTDYQWASTTPNPTNEIFMVAHSGAVVSENPLENTVCSLQMTSGGYFKPAVIYVCNSTYTYFVAKNGNAFSNKFTADDELVLNVVGVRNGAMTAHLRTPLIKYGLYQNEWGRLPLSQLGTVDKILFYVDSTAKNAYGLTVPAYFCLAGFWYSLPEAGTK